MSRDAEAVLDAALELSEEDRGHLAGALLASLEPPADTDVETAWRREVAARVAAADAGEVEAVPWDEIRDQLFARLNARRAS
ncbi:MAG: addiction module protein [Acidobacteriota bacterium]